MAREEFAPAAPHFQHDIQRLNQCAEQAGLFATVWLGRMMLDCWLPDHAKESYIVTLAHNYRAPHDVLNKQIKRLALRLDEQYSTPARPLRVQQWVQEIATLNELPPLPNIAAERRCMRFLALRDLQEFIGAFAADAQQRRALRSWVQSALRQAMTQNQLENAWNNSITVWDDAQPPRPRTVVRAALQPGLWRDGGLATIWH